MKEISAHALSDFLDEHPDTLIIDVRFDYEREEVGYLDDSLHVPWFTPDWEINPDFINKIKMISSRGCRMVMVCRSGHRSGDACQLLEEHGYREVYNLKGGHIALAQAEAIQSQPLLSGNFTRLTSAIPAVA